MAGGDKRLSRVVDERIAEMRFDNKDFEQNVSESLSTLDKLKKALDFGNAGHSFDNITNAASRINIGSIGEEIEGVTAKFSALEIAGVTALVNIANKAVDAGLAMAKSLTIDQITAGFDKYADKTTAVQTIMAATRQDFEDEAEQMEYVNDQLEKLNFFTDETSYNFVDMVSNIGKFTSAGVNLDEAVTSMQGVATWAAMSGANAMQASRAMYNLAQATGKGFLQLIDWKSIENANMATMEFKEMAIQAGLALGTLEKVDGQIMTVDTGLANKFNGLVVDARNFSSTLSDGWLTIDVLNKTLNEYGGFANRIYEVYEETGLEVLGILKYTDEYAEGLLDLAELENETGVEAERLAEIFSELNDPMYALGRKAYETAQEAKTFAEVIAYTEDAVSSGWMNTFEIIFGDYAEAKEMWSGLAEVFYELFVQSGEVRNAILGVWKELGGRTSMLQSVSNAYQAFVKVIETVKDAFQSVFPSRSVNERGKALYNFTEQVREFTERLILSEEAAKKLQNFVTPFFKTLKNTIGVIKSLGVWLKEYIVPSLSIIFGSLKKLFVPLSSIATTIKELVKSSFAELERFNFLSTIAGNIAEGFRMISQDFDGVIEKTAELLTGFNETLRTSETLKNVINTIKMVLFELASGITNILNLSALITTFKNSGGGIAGILSVIKFELFAIWNTVSGVLKQITGIDMNSALIGWSNKLKEIVNNSERLQNAISVLKELKDDLVFGVKSLFNFNEIISVFNQNGGGFAGVLAVIKRELSIVLDIIKNVIEDLTGINFSDNIFSQIADKISGALERIKQAFSDFRNTDTGGVDDVVGKVEEKLSPLAAFLDGIKRAVVWTWDKLKGFGPKISEAIDNIGGSLKQFKDKITSLTGKDVFNFALLSGSVASVIMLIGKGINLFWSLVGKFKDINVLKSIASGIRETIDNLSYSLDDLQKSIKANVLLKIAIAITAITLSVAKLSEIDPVNLGLALGAVTFELKSLMSALGQTVKMTSLFEASKLKTIGLAMIELSIAITILSSAVKKLSKIEFWSMIQGLVGVGALLSGLALFINFTKLDNVSAKDLVGVIFIAEAIKILSGAVKKLSDIEFWSMIQGLVGVGITLQAMKNFINTVDFSHGTSISGALSIILMAEAIKVLASAVKKVGELKLGDVVEGLISVMLLINSLQKFLLKSKFNGLNIQSGAGLLIMAFALKVIAGVVADISSYNLKEIGLGLLAIGGILLELGGFVFLLEKSKISGLKLMALALGMAKFASAVKILSEFAKEVYYIDWKVLGKGAVVMAAGLGILVGAAILMNKAILGVAGILLMTFALKQLLPVIKSFSSMGWEEIGKSLAELAGILAVIGLAGLLLGPIAPLILALGGALAVLGKGLVTISIAMTLFSVAFTLLSTIGSAGALALAGTLKVLLLGFIKFVGESAMAIAKTIVSVIKAFLYSFKELIPSLVETVAATIDSLFKVIVKYGPSIVNSIGTLIIMLLKFAKDHLPILIDLFIETIFGILLAIADKMPDFVMVGIDLIISLVDGLGEGLVKNAPRLRDSLLNFADNLLGAILGFFGIDKLVGSPSSKFTDIGKNLVLGLIEGVKNKINDAVQAVKDLGNKILEKFTNLFRIDSPSKVFESFGLNFDEGLSIGVENGTGGVIDTIKNFASDIIGVSGDEFGKNSFNLFDVLGFSDEFSLPDTTNFMDAVSSVEGVEINPVFEDDDLLSNFGDVVSEIEETPITPTVSPVLDMEDFNSSLGRVKDDYVLDTNLGISGSTQSNMNGFEIIQNEIKMLNRDVTDYLARFREDTTYIVNNLSKIRVVMDTEALVGTLVVPMDEALGRRAMLAERGV